MCDFTSRKRAGLNLEGGFLVRIVYDDMKTYDLVEAATDVLGNDSHYFSN